MTEAWAFMHFYYMDHANACMHLAEVRFSPITFDLAQRLDIENNLVADLPSGLLSALEEVDNHRGLYLVDPGR